MADVLFPAAVIMASGQYSSSGGTITGPVLTLSAPVWFAEFGVMITVAPSTSYATGSLDVYLQHSIDYAIQKASSTPANATWDDFLHFPQITCASTSTRGNSSFGSWTSNINASSSMNFHLASTGTLGAGQVINGAIGGSIRAQAVIANAPTVPSSSAWTFSVLGQFYK